MQSRVSNLDTPWVIVDFTNVFTFTADYSIDFEYGSFFETGIQETNPKVAFSNVGLNIHQHFDLGLHFEFLGIYKHFIELLLSWLMLRQYLATEKFDMGIQADYKLGSFNFIVSYFGDFKIFNVSIVHWLLDIVDDG